MKKTSFVLLVGAALSAAALAQTFDASPEIVASVQTSLAARGFSPGPATGRMNRETTSALQQLQRSRGLAPTGNLDERTLATLGINIQRTGAAPSAATVISSTATPSPNAGLPGTGIPGTVPPGTNALGGTPPGAPSPSFGATPAGAPSTLFTPTPAGAPAPALSPSELATSTATGAAIPGTTTTVTTTTTTTPTTSTTTTTSPATSTGTTGTTGSSGANPPAARR